jgi:hypothetical protein
MVTVLLFNRIRWISKISFIILFFLERAYYFEGYPTEDSTTIKYFKITILVFFILTSIIENKMIIKAKDKQIEQLKKQLYDKT